MRFEDRRRMANREQYVNARTTRGLRLAVLIAALIAVGLIAAGVIHAQGVPTRGGNNLRTSVYTDAGLSVANVAARGLRVWFTLPMEGDARGAESQPLIQPGVTMQDGGKRDVVIVSAMNNLVWAYDANSSDILWTQKLGIPINGSAAIDFWKINDHWSVLSTGVIDGATNMWYGVTWNSPDGSAAKGKHWLYALNLKDGSFVFPPVQLPAEYDAVMRKQRSSLGLATFGGKKTILFASGTVLETSSTAAGYLTAFDIASKTFTLFKMAGSGWGAGVWMGGAGLIIDESIGAIFGVSGNGEFDPGAGKWSETAFRASYTPPSLTAAAKLAIADWFTPYTDMWREGKQPAAKMAVVEPRLAGHSLSSDRAGPVDISPEGLPVNAMHMRIMAPGVAMGDTDQDLGSGPLTYIPQNHMLIASGKDGVAYLVNSVKMGKTQLADLVNPAVAYKALLSPPIWYEAYAGNDVSPDPTDFATLNRNAVFDGKTHHHHSTDVVFQSPTNGTVIFTGGENSNIRAWRVTGTTLSYLGNSDDVASPDLANSVGGMTGWMLWASTNGLLFATRPHGDANKSVTAGDLFVFDANNFATRPDGSKQLRVLWRSDQHGINFVFNKFCPGLVYNAKVYVPTYSGQTLVFGLN